MIHKFCNILSVDIFFSLSADIVLFNSNFNKTTFLDNIQKIVKILPDHRPKKLKEQIEVKSQVLYFPISFPENMTFNRSSVLHIVWPHRWEFDKGPEQFFEVMLKLKKNNYKFKLSVLGEIFCDVPEIFDSVKEELKDEIVHYGFLDSKEEYFNVLRSCHVVVSTANHEFFGVSMYVHMSQL